MAFDLAKYGKDNLAMALPREKAAETGSLLPS
jgi:hypothetical protein